MGGNAVSPVHLVSLSTLKGTDRSLTYSIPKFLALRAYCRTAPTWRMLWKCLTLPLPALLFAVVPAMLPLKHPREGVTVWYIFHAVCIIASAFLGATLHYTAATGLVEAGLFRKILFIITIAGVVASMQVALTQIFWIMPVPFGLVAFATMGFFDIGIIFILVLGRSLWALPIFRRSLVIYLPSMAIQTTQIIIYPAFSVIYDKANDTQRILLTLVFPILKYGLKQLLKCGGRQLGEYQTEVAVSGVEICASLYQSMIMQAVPSTAAMAVIMGIDVIQGVVSVKIFADRHADPSVPRHSLFDEAERMLALPQSEAGHDLTESEADKARQTTIQRALDLATTAESILLVEYYEVIIPIVNGLFLLVAAQFPSARFNSRIAPLYNDRGQLVSALLSLLVYSILQGLSCVAMHVVMKRRYGISAIAHLSFVLERYHASILGKMLAWLPIILHFTLMHYGSDFSFRFRFQGEYW